MFPIINPVPKSILLLDYLNFETLFVFVKLYKIYLSTLNTIKLNSISMS